MRARDIVDAMSTMIAGNTPDVIARADRLERERDECATRLRMTQRALSEARQEMVTLAGFYPSEYEECLIRDGEKFSIADALDIARAELSQYRLWNHPLLAEAMGALAATFPGGLVVDRASQDCPELRVGPFVDRAGTWGVVRLADGRREVRAFSQDTTIFKVEARQ